jgi:hypothetical protein
MCGPHSAQQERRPRASRDLHLLVELHSLTENAIVVKQAEAKALAAAGQSSVIASKDIRQMYNTMLKKNSDFIVRALPDNFMELLWGDDAPPTTPKRGAGGTIPAESPMHAAAKDALQNVKAAEAVTEAVATAVATAVAKAVPEAVAKAVAEAVAEAVSEAVAEAESANKKIVAAIKDQV